ncbi:right-handed parallel beta-helix repeat-containing protein [Mesorhizobium sp.]|uniref:right-handed parallel beta-helix repeat-containing protein n=1 Tax=Mesorhizobium sp. TaxID=1871066 RepID=UPI0025FBAB4B|nr:right-handed parallel beta-helix repeat-containing protein [Mesorhizobium sp.]
MATTSVDQVTGYGETLALKAPCRLATTANIALSGLQTIDGEVTVANDRVLVRDQDTPSQNGIYIAASGAWQRARDMDSNRDLTKGTRVYVTEGDSGPAEFEVTTESPITVGSSSIAFDLSAGSVNAAALSAAAAAAEASADIAAGLASAFIISENTFDTKATAAAWSPVAAPNYIRTAGALAADDGSGAVFAKGSGNGGFSINLSGGGTQAYKPAKERGYDIRLFGAGPARTAAQNTAALVLAMSYTTELWVPPLAAGEYFDVNDEFTVLDHVKIRGAGWHSRIRQTVREKNIFIAGDHSSFEGLHLIGDNLLTGADFTKNNGIYASGKKGVVVQNCFGEKFEGCGAQLRGCKDYKVVNNTFFANPWGSFSTSGDIIIYSFADAGRGVITGNHCLSNNSQGIYADVIGYDADIIIANNVVVTLDPATCIEGGAWTEAVGDYSGTPATVRRRHAIGVGYNSSNVAGPRSVVIGNICRNTRWTGIYKQGVSAGGGGVLIIGNQCSKNGLEQANSLNGGIYVTATGEDVVSGNMITDFQSTGAGVGGITITSGTAPTRPTKIQGNMISNSLGQGISVGTHAAYIDIQDNVIVGSATTDIYIVNASNVAAGGHTVRGNKIKRTSGDSIPSIRISTPSSLLYTTVKDNDVEGFDNSNAVSTNVGITTTNMLITRVLRNRVKNFHVAIQSTAYFTAGARYPDVVLENNTIDDCTTGFGLASTANTAVVPVIGNRFTNVTNKTAASTTHTGLAGTKCGYICRKDDDRLVVLELAAAPTVGTWAAGDRAEFAAPAAGAAPGAVCTAGGNPGTWNAQAAIAA